MKRIFFTVTMIVFFAAVFTLNADETVYNSKEVPLAEINRNVFGKILNKPQNEIYPKVKVIRPENWSFVDIRKFCNMGFEDDVSDNCKGGWTDSGKSFDLHPFGPGYGTVKFYGVPFDIIDPGKNNNKTMITMKSGWKTDPHFPDKVDIPVNKKLSALYFLHSSSWGVTRWGMGASRRYEVVYNDGTVVRIPIICAGGHENIANWMWKPSGGLSLLDTSSAKPVPVKIDKDIRYLYTLEWINPHPDKVIKEIRVITKNDKKWFTIVVLGITGLKQ